MSKKKQYENLTDEELVSRAEQGHPRGQYELGSMYYFGQGVPQDHAEAIVWYRRAAEQGDARAQYLLGEMYKKEKK